MIQTWMIKAGAGLLVIVSLFGFGWMKGSAHTQEKWDQERAEIAIADAERAKWDAEKTVEVVTKYVDRVRVVVKKGDTITKEVPVYVTPKDDSNCVINNGFVRVHNDSATMQIPDTTSHSDGKASSFKLSDIATTVTANYTACHQNSEQLIALQSWVKEITGKAQP